MIIITSDVSTQLNSNGASESVYSLESLLIRRGMCVQVFIGSFFQFPGFHSSSLQADFGMASKGARELGMD